MTTLEALRRSHRWHQAVVAALLLAAPALTSAGVRSSASASLPTMMMSFSAAKAVINGASVRMTITVSNPSDAGPLTAVRVSNTFPIVAGKALLAVAPTPLPASTCSGGGSIAGVFDPQPGDLSITLTGATLTQGQTCSVAVNVVAQHSGGAFEYAASNVAQATAIGNAGKQEIQDASAPITLRSPLEMRAWFGDSVFRGSTTSKGFTLDNVGNQPLTLVSFRNTPLVSTAGPEFQFLQQPPITVTCGNDPTPLPGNLFATTADGAGIELVMPLTLPPGAHCHIQTRFVVNAPHGDFSIIDRVPEGAITFSDPAIVSQGTETALNIRSALSVTLQASDSAVTPGDAVRYYLYVTNGLYRDIGPVTLQNLLTDGQTLLTGMIGGNLYDPYLSPAQCRPLTTLGATGENKVAFTWRRTNYNYRGETAPPINCMIIFHAMTPAVPTVAHNVIPALGVCSDDGAHCNGTASNATVVQPLVTLAASASYGSSNSPLEGQTAHINIKLVNGSRQALEPVTITSTLPVSSDTGAQMILSPDVPIGGNCGQPVLTSTAGSPVVRIEGVSVPSRSWAYQAPMGTCTLTLPVVAPAGTYTVYTEVAAMANYANGTVGALQTVIASTSPITVQRTLNADLSVAEPRYQALTDGLILMRYMLGVRGTPLTSGALAVDALRTDPDAIANHLAAQVVKLDVDGNGVVDAATDGTLFLRYLLGLRGDALVDGAIGANASRNTAPNIEAWLSSVLP